MSEPEHQELMRQPAMEVARPEPTVGEILQAIVQKGVTHDNVVAVEKIVALYERLEDKKAEKEFAKAFVGLQAEMPKVQATSAVPNNDGSVRFKFASFEALMAQVGPMLQKHGFTISFSSRIDATRIVSTCTLQHVGGHKRSNDFAVRIGSGPPKASEAQADGAASTYAKRFALTECLNIVVAHMDSDARLEGGAITAEQAAELERRVKETNSNEAAFLRFASAKSYAEITSGKYAILDEFLTKKARKQQ